jgi:ribosome-associated toxin RatA of RatAB toxin-antitoxin module
VQKLEVSAIVKAPVEQVFDAVCDLEERTRNVPAFQRIEYRSRTADGYVATVFEHYGGRDVVVTSQYRFKRPGWLTYEHIEGPYGENRGKFTIEETPDGTRLHQVHETEQDISEGTALRDDWLKIMRDQLAAISRSAEVRAKQSK